MEAIHGFSFLLRVHSFVSGTNLVKKAIYAMVEGDCDEVSEPRPSGAVYEPNFNTFAHIT